MHNQKQAVVFSLLFWDSQSILGKKYKTDSEENAVSAFNVHRVQ